MQILLDSSSDYIWNLTIFIISSAVTLVQGTTFISPLHYCSSLPAAPFSLVSAQQPQGSRKIPVGPCHSSTQDPPKAPLPAPCCLSNTTSHFPPTHSLDSRCTGLLAAPPPSLRPCIDGSFLLERSSQIAVCLTLSPLCSPASVVPSEALLLSPAIYAPCPFPAAPNILFSFTFVHRWATCSSHLVLVSLLHQNVGPSGTGLWSVLFADLSPESRTVLGT